ncbi:MAG: biopolymer transporter ExbD [Phycisphaerales bacterium]|jgi:biopolymer transport protein ExbD|nr:biopolymer transporter ExbD [Phycisphaerales bacterium]
MKLNKRSSEETAGLIELTPMIDIVFLLIIFFMVAAQFAQQSRLDLNLPKELGDGTEEQQQRGLVINIREDDAIILDTNEPPVSLTKLEETITQAIATGSPPWQSLLIRADRNASTTALNGVLKILNKHGLSATRIATEVP